MDTLCYLTLDRDVQPPCVADIETLLAPSVAGKLGPDHPVGGEARNDGNGSIDRYAAPIARVLAHRASYRRAMNVEIAPSDEPNAGVSP